MVHFHGAFSMCVRYTWNILKVRTNCKTLGHSALGQGPRALQSHSGIIGRHYKALNYNVEKTSEEVIS